MSSVEQSYSVTESAIAIVPVLGPLVARGDWLTALLGAGEYGGARHRPRGQEANLADDSRATDNQCVADKRAELPLTPSVPSDMQAVILCNAIVLAIVDKQ